MHFELKRWRDTRCEHSSVWTLGSPLHCVWGCRHVPAAGVSGPPRGSAAAAGAEPSPGHTQVQTLLPAQGGSGRQRGQRGSVTPTPEPRLSGGRATEAATPEAHTSRSALLTQTRRLVLVRPGTPSRHGARAPGTVLSPGHSQPGHSARPPQASGGARLKGKGPRVPCDEWAKPPDWHRKAPENMAAPPGDARTSITGHIHPKSGMWTWGTLLPEGCVQEG